MRTLALLIGIGLSVVACDDKTGTTPVTTDLSKVSDLAFASACGHPGDKAIDATGIGLFCTTLAMCVGNDPSTICSNIGDPTTFFCTQVCNGKPAGFCGANAVCICDGGPTRCGCVPKKCNPPDGGI
jgi:hypothetical protein